MIDVVKTAFSENGPLFEQPSIIFVNVGRAQRTRMSIIVCGERVDRFYMKLAMTEASMRTTFTGTKLLSFSSLSIRFANGSPD